jgi:hypothetical protein
MLPSLPTGVQCCTHTNLTQIYIFYELLVAPHINPSLIATPHINTPPTLGGTQLENMEADLAAARATTDTLLERAVVAETKLAQLEAASSSGSTADTTAAAVAEAAAKAATELARRENQLKAAAAEIRMLKAQSSAGGVSVRRVHSRLRRTRLPVALLSCSYGFGRMVSADCASACAVN